MAKQSLAPPRIGPGDLVAFLQSDAARLALADLAAQETGAEHSLRLVETLRRDFSPDEAAALLTQARLRKRAATKWPFAQHLLLVEEALEQATAWPVALQRAVRLHALAPQGALLDLGCGIGGDLLALAAHRPVIAYESDPQRAAFARANVASVQAGWIGPCYPVEVRCTDWTTALADGSLAPAAATFADPARRRADHTGASRRTFSLHGMQPPIGALLPLLDRVGLMAIKVAPGLDLNELPAQTAVEFVSHEGTCKEAVLWMGESATGLPCRWASVHDGARWFELPTAGEAAPAMRESERPQPGQIIWEPDAAVIRAGALDVLCERLDGSLFAPDIAYIVSGSGAVNQMHVFPFATPFRLLEAHPFNLKGLARRLEALDAGPVEFKKRGFPLEPEALRSRLKWRRGGRPITVLLTRRGDAHWMLLAERVLYLDHPANQEVP